MSQPFYMEDIGSQTLFLKYIFREQELDFDNQKVFNTTQYPSLFQIFL